MTPEILMQPRVKCIGVGNFHYPESPFHVGQIIIANQVGWPDSIKHFEKYPHLFEVLPWYAERAEGDMPEYIIGKHKGEAVYLKVEFWDITGSYPSTKVDGIEYYAPYSKPITEQEYNTYNQSQK